MKKRALTGYRPTGKLHLGHWFGNLQNMLRMQDEYDAYYFVADYHALTSDWQNPQHIARFTDEMVLDWVAAGLDPERCTIYRQSDVPQVAELSLLFNMVLPMTWLERTPSYKEQRAQITDKDLSNVGFFLYPSLQAADIAIVRSDYVPVGEDQAPHLELTREIIRRLNGTYGEYLIEPKAIIPEDGARVPGLDGRKMSKSYGNSIYISDTPEEITKAVMGCVTDPARKLKTDPGDPDICPLHQIHKLIAPESEIARWESECRAAEVGCVAHKRAVAEELTAYLAPFQERRAALAATPDFARDVLAAGKEKVTPIADETVGRVRELMGL
ncbi:MAG: tryptophan--tRNA ligase [Coriobacteriia bacterium]|nr:tryptophan--tRNA ligase [Coriobacteriia bacterium]